MCKIENDVIIDIDNNKSVRSLVPNEEFLKDKKSYKNLYVVRDGLVKFRVSYKGTVSLDLFYKGSVLGGVGFLFGDNFECTAIAGCKTEICELNQETVEQLLTSQPKFMTRYLLATGSYFSNIKEQQCMAQMQPVAFLFAKALLKDFQLRSYIYNNVKTVSKVLTQEEWAQHIGTTRESISRIVRKLEKDNILRFNSGSISLLDELELIKFTVSAEVKN